MKKLLKFLKLVEIFSRISTELRRHARQRKYFKKKEISNNCSKICLVKDKELTKKQRVI